MTTSERELTDDDYRRLLELRTGLRRFVRWSEQQARNAGITPAQQVEFSRRCGELRVVGEEIVQARDHVHTPVKRREDDWSPPPGNATARRSDADEQSIGVRRIIERGHDGRRAADGE